jgi:hypothetical protein
MISYKLYITLVIETNNIASAASLCNEVRSKATSNSPYIENKYRLNSTMPKRTFSFRI